jgi:hypothetical protein
MPSPLPIADDSILDHITIATPCSERWDDMIGDDRVRFCRKCELDVFDLSAMTRTEAAALIHERAGRICARLYRRADGTVIARSCAGVLRRERFRTVAAAACIVALGVGLMLVATAHTLGAVAPVAGSR